MNIFKKRPLSLILCIMLVAFSFFAKYSIAIKLIVVGVILSIFGASFIFKPKNRGSIKKARILLVVISISIFLSALWSALFFPTKYYEKTVDIEAKIYDIDTSSYNSKIILKTTDISGKKDKHIFLFYVDRDTAATLRKYDVISVRATVHSFSESNDSFNGSNYYIGKGVSAYIDDAEDLSVIDNKPDKLDRFFSNTSLKLSNTFKKRSDYETGAFLSAIIIGNRDDLDGNTRLNFSRSGISHILALSGMHLAILSAALTKMLSILRVNKKFRVILISVFTLFYMALTGFSSSVVRAGVMLIITGILYLLSQTSDSVTSLFIAVSVIILFTPYAAFDISLWLSAFATLGVIAFSELRSSDLISKQIGSVKSLLICMRDGVLVSMFAFAATFAISVVNFKSFSVVSLFSTLVFAFLIEVFVYLGLIALVVGRFIPMNRILILISDLIKILAEKLGNIRWIYASASSLSVTVLLCVFSVFFFGFLLIDTKKKKLCVIILCTLLISVFSVAVIDAAVVRNKDDVIYSPDSAGDAFLIKSDGEISLIYSGKSSVSASYTVLDLLVQEKITYLDVLVIANYSYSSIQFCQDVIDGVKTDRILLPVPETKDELNQAEGLADMLSLYGTDMRFYKKMDEVHLGEYSFKLLDKHAYKYGEKPMNVFKIYSNESSFLYITAGEYTDVNVDAKMELYNCEHLFIGTQGNSKYNRFNMLLPNIKSINYGDSERLTEDAIDYYERLEAEINYIKTSASLLK